MLELATIRYLEYLIIQSHLKDHMVILGNISFPIFLFNQPSGREEFRGNRKLLGYIIFSKSYCSLLTVQSVFFLTANSAQAVLKASLLFDISLWSKMLQICIFLVSRIELDQFRSYWIKQDKILNFFEKAILIKFLKTYS